jgi:hypothetical protein
MVCGSPCGVGAPIGGAPGGGIRGKPMVGVDCGIMGGTLRGGGEATFISARVIALRWSITPVLR